MREEDEKFLKSLLDVDMRDMIFQHHMHSQNWLNIFVISFQLVSWVVGVFASIITHSPMVSKYSASINVVLLIIVVMNNYIHNTTWKEAKDKYDKIVNMNDIINDEGLTSEDKHLHLSNIRGYKIKHSDEEFEKLVNGWYKNITCKKPKKLRYKDDNGDNYHIGDIVFNPCFGDLWLIEKLFKEEMKEYNFETPYVFTLYGDRDSYMMEITEPKGFVIECTPNDAYKYIKYLVLFSKAYKSNKIIQEHIDNENKEEQNVEE